MSTIKDISQMTGLSLGTISKYLNGKPVLPKNAETIQEAIEHLNYQVNTFARGLKANHTMSVGILIHHWENPFVMSMLSTLEQRLYDKGYSISVCAYNGSQTQEYDKFHLLSSRSDAMIIMPLYIDADFFKKNLHREIPIISIDRPIVNYCCDTILIDSLNTAYVVTEQFITHGHKRIAILAGTKQVYNAPENVKGYTRAFDDYGLEVDPAMIAYGDHRESTGYRLTKQFLDMKNPPTAIFAATHEMMRGALAAINESSFRIPDDISFVGSDDAHNSSSYSQHISMVLLPSDTMANHLADLLIMRIEERVTGFPKLVRLKTQYVDQNSINVIADQSKRAGKD